MIECTLFPVTTWRSPSSFKSIRLDMGGTDVTDMTWQVTLTDSIGHQPLRGPKPHHRPHFHPSTKKGHQVPMTLNALHFCFVFTGSFFVKRNFPCLIARDMSWISIILTIKLHSKLGTWNATFVDCLKQIHKITFVNVSNCISYKSTNCMLIFMVNPTLEQAFLIYDPLDRLVLIVYSLNLELLWLKWKD